jgi:flagellar biosynthesis component FlhA
LEKVSDYAAVTKNPDELSEHARRALGAQITKLYQTENGNLRAITLDPKLEQQIAHGVRQTSTDVALVMEPGLTRHVMETLSKYVQQMLSAGHPPSCFARRRSGWHFAASSKRLSLTWRSSRIWRSRPGWRSKMRR